MTLTQNELKKIKLSQYIEIIQAFLDGKGIEFRENNNAPWKDAPNPNFNFGYADYRIKPPSPDEFNWDSVDKKYNWYARDKSGLAYFYSTMPVIERGQWRFPAGASVGPKPSVFSSAGALSIELGTCSWEDSLQSRPGVI